MNQKSWLVVMVLLSVSAGIAGGVLGGLATPFLLVTPSGHWLTQKLAATVYSVPGSSKGLIDDGTMDVVAGASRAVVSIVATRAMDGEDAPIDFFDPLSHSSTSLDVPADSVRVPETMPVGAGSGFFVSSSGLIVTNRHVVQDKRVNYTVVTQDGVHHSAKVVAIDPSMDLAFIHIAQVDGEPYPFLLLGDSDGVRVGQPVIAIGNALAEFQNTVTKGVISGMHRHLMAGDQVAGSELIEEAIQTDAAINLGNSGGPLLDLSGRVIGVNTAISQDAQSLGFALPSRAVLRDLQSLEKAGHIVKPWLGVRYTQITRDAAAREKLTYPYGARVIGGRSRAEAAIIPGSPAEKAGLKEGDILLEVQGQRIDEDHSLGSLIARQSPRDQIRLRILRDGHEQEVSVTLDERQTDVR